MPAKKLLDKHFRFVAMFTWENTEDIEAVNKFRDLFDNLPEGIDFDSFEGYYMTGHRTIIFIGQAISTAAVQRFTSAITFDSAMKGKVSLALEIHELRGIIGGQEFIVREEKAT
jgi:hypothetical protein